MANATTTAPVCTRPAAQDATHQRGPVALPLCPLGVRGRRAFFFVREQYIGTDAASPSARLRVASQDQSKITLAYGRFAAGDKACCPSDGTVKVRFSMSDGRLQPLDPIPPAAARLPPA